MYYINNDAVDYFAAAFAPKDSIICETHRPLGFYAAETLETAGSQAWDILRKAEQFKAEFQVFLAARSPSSTAVALQSLKALWRALGELPDFPAPVGRQQRRGAASLSVGATGRGGRHAHAGDAAERGLCAVDE